MKSKWFLFITLVFFIIAYIHLHPALHVQLLGWLTTLSGTKALVIISFIYIFSNLFILPLGLPITLLAGIIWGPFAGGFLINFLATSVAVISFLIARYLGEDFCKKYFDKYQSLLKIKNIIKQHDWQFVAMARLNPIVPFNISNYLFGLIPELSFKHYLFATFLGNLLPSIFFAYLGSICKTLSLSYYSHIHSFIVQISILIFILSLFASYKLITSGNYYVKRNSQ